MSVSALAPKCHNIPRSIALLGRAICFTLAAGLSIAAPTAAIAAPTVVVNNQNNTANDGNEQAADPQVAPLPASPFNQDANQANQNGNTQDNPDALANPNSLANDMQPNDSELSVANQELLSRNAQLQRDVNDLETRVNVLINERSGQLFMYGAVTVAVSLFLGILLGGFIFSRRERW